MWYLGEDEMEEAAVIDGYDGIGALYEAPDGSLYELEGLDHIPARRSRPGMAPPPGARGRPRARFRRVGSRRRRRRRRRPFLKKLLPIAKAVAPFIPGVGPVAATALRVAEPALRKAGVAGYYGLGELYEAPDGTVYQAAEVVEPEELEGLWADEPLTEGDEEALEGLYEDEYELDGLGAEEEEDDELELEGWFGEDEVAAEADDDDELAGWLGEDDEELDDLGQCYLKEPGVEGLDAFVPAQPPTTRFCSTPAGSAEMFKALW